MSITKFYLLPIEQVAHARGPKYLKWKYGQGLQARWSLKDFGNAPDIGLVATDAIITRPDVLELGEWTGKQRGAIAAYLRNSGLEAGWVTQASDWREGLQRLAGLTQAYQSDSDNPHLWLGREFHFGLAKLNPLDQRYFEQEQLARAEQKIEELRVRWSVQKPAFDWRAMLKIFALNPLSIFTAALPATDTFTAANGTDLTTYSASWTYNNGSFVINTNSVCSAGGPSSDEIAHWNADTFNANQYSQGTVVAIGTLQYVGVSVRCAASAFTCYDYLANSDDGAYLGKYVAGTYTQLGSKTAVFAVNDVVYIDANGTSITPKRNGSTTNTPGTQTDSSISSGSAGIAGAGASSVSRLDNWEGGNLSPNISLSVSDALTVGESSAVTVSGGTPALTINVSDELTVGENTPPPIIYSDKIYFVSSQETAWSSVTQSPVVNAPAGIQNGDLLLMFLVTSTTTNMSGVGGWAVAGSEVDVGTTDNTTVVLWKIASSEGASWTMTNVFNSTESGMAVVLVYRNAHQSSPINQTNQTSATAATSLSGPSVTPNADGSMIIQFAGADPGTGAYSGTPDSSPAATERFDAKESTGGSLAYTYIQEYWQSSAAAIALDVTALTSDDYGYHQIAIKANRIILTSENITVDDTVSLQIVGGAVSGTFSVSDGLTVGESVTVAVSSPKINVSDSLTLGETTSLAMPASSALQINVADDVAVIDAPFYGETIPGMSVSDGLTVGESVTVTVSAPKVSVSDGLTIGEVVTPTLILSPSVSDGLTVGESVTAKLAVSVTVSDGLTVGEAAAAYLTTGVNVSDGLTVGDSTTDKLILLPNVSDTLAVGESVALALTTQVNVSDALTLGETTALTITTTGQVAINVSDGLTVGETVTLNILTQVSVTDGLTVGESVTSKLLALVGVSDSLTIGETTQAAVSTQVNVSDGLTIGESAQAVVSTTPVNVSDGLTVGESVSLNILTAGQIAMSVSDGLTVGEAVTLNLLTALSVSDGLTLGESTSVTILTAGQIAVNVSDGLTIGEVTTANLLTGLSVSDALTVGESVNALLTTQVNVSDGLTIGETAGTAIPLPVSVVEPLMIGDSTSVKTALGINVADGLTLGESVNILVYTPGATIFVSVSDGLTVADITTMAVMVIARRLHLKEQKSNLTLKTNSASPHLRGQ